jgi:hypothetical protein
MFMIMELPQGQSSRGNSQELVLVRQGISELNKNLVFRIFAGVMLANFVSFLCICLFTLYVGVNLPTLIEPR